MSIVAFLFVGLVAGWLTGLIMKGSGYGLLGDILVGIVGAVIGGWIFGLLNVPATFGVIGSIIMATIGAVVFVFLLHMIGQAGKGVTSR